MRYYHATSASQAILADGSRDWSGSYGGLRDVEGTPLILTGVFISDRQAKNVWRGPAGAFDRKPGQ